MQSFRIPHKAETVNLPSSPLIEYIRLGLENQAVPLSSGQPHPSRFPLEALGKTTRKGIPERGERFLRYGSSRGIGPLRSWILEWMQKERICLSEVSEREILLVPGCQSDFDLLCQALLEPGDLVAMDAPCYPDSWCTLQRRGEAFYPWQGWETKRIIWISSFSKILAPGLRSAWIVAPREVTDLFGAPQEISCISPPAVGSLGVYVYLRDYGEEKKPDRFLRLSYSRLHPEEVPLCMEAFGEVIQL